MDLQILPWRRVVDRADALPLALDIAGMPRRVSGDTGIGRGLMAALDLLEARPSCAARRIVNVSGDGRESYGPQQGPWVSLAVARDRAIRMGVTVNGLAITIEAPDPAKWYRDWVITGPGGVRRDGGIVRGVRRGDHPQAGAGTLPVCRGGNGDSTECRSITTAVRSGLQPNGLPSFPAVEGTATCRTPEVSPGRSVRLGVGLRTRT